jgi:hypothetical protein
MPSRRLLIAASLILLVSSVRANIDPGQAALRAVNEIRAGSGVVSLEHPRYEAFWTSSGFQVYPRKGPAWRWELQSVRVASMPLKVAGDVQPIADGKRMRIDYDRGALIERYVCKTEAVEQQFVLPRPISRSAGDLVIEGKVTSNGSFHATDKGWIWSGPEGVVSLGRLTVFDGQGIRLPSSMIVSADRIRLMVDGEALAAATYPVTLDPEVGTNDFRISNVGIDGTTTSGASSPNVAYDSTNNQYLVVWWQTDGAETEIYGQLIDGSGNEAGSDFRISDMGPNGNANYAAYNPAVAFNSTNGEFLVVWQGDDNTAPLVDDEFEIFGRRVSTGGATIGSDFRISNMGTDGNPSSGAASYGKVAYNSVNNEYLVVWIGTDGTGETEVRGQRLVGSTAAETGAQMTYSSIGTAGDTNRGPTNHPDVAFNATNGQYLVVWAGDALTTDNENEVYGQRVTASTGAETGSDFRISFNGPDGDQNYVAYNVAVAWNSIDNQYLVVWNGTDDTAPLVQFENEIFGRLIVGSTGALVGSDHIRISNAGTDGDTAREALDPDVAFSAAANEYLVAWRADAGTTNDEIEIWAQRIDSDGSAIGGDVRLSDMGPEGNTNYRPFSQQIAAAGANYLVVWFSDDDSGILVDDENEIFGQLFVASVSMSSPMIDDFSVNQGPLTLGAVIGTVTDHNADSSAIHGGERNLRISGSNASGENITVTVSGGALTFNRTASSNGEIAAWWDGDNDSGSFDVINSLPYDLTANGTLDSFRVAIASASSAVLEMRIYVYTNGTSVSRIHFTLPTGGGNVDLLYTNFITHGSAPADFSAIRAIYFSTVSNTGAFSATIDSIRARSSTFGAPVSLTATATSTSAVGVSWPAVGGATSYEVWRSSLGSAYSLLTTSGGTTMSDLGLTANRTYLYKVRAISPGETSAFGPIDPATTIIFTDPALSSAIKVKAVHLTELRTAVNAMQQAAGQAPTTFPETITALVTTIKASHITGLRSALDAARSTIGLTPISYIDPTLVVGATTIKSAHVTQLRSGTQ